MGEEGKRDYTVAQNLRSEVGSGATSNRVLYIYVHHSRHPTMSPLLSHCSPHNLSSVTEKCTSPHAGKHTPGPSSLCRALSLSPPSHRPPPSLHTRGLGSHSASLSIPNVGGCQSNRRSSCPRLTGAPTTRPTRRSQRRVLYAWVRTVCTRAQSTCTV